MATVTRRSKSSCKSQSAVPIHSELYPLGDSHLRAQPTTPRATQSRIQKLLHRTKSEGPAIRHDSLKIPERESGEPSPVRANMKRRRSAASVVEHARQISRYDACLLWTFVVKDVNQATDNVFGCRSPARSIAELSSPATGGHSSGSLSQEVDTYGHPTDEPIFNPSPAAAPQREPSRGRRRFRSPTPFPIVRASYDVATSEDLPAPRRQKSRPDSRRPKDKFHNTEEHGGDRAGRTTSPRAHTSTKARDRPRKACRALKGGFLVTIPKQAEKFLFPVLKGEPDPIWRAGDGFSDEEAAPGFLFYVTGQKKHTKPTLTTGFGTLPLVPAMTMHPVSIRHSLKRRKVDQSSIIRCAALLRGRAKEPWPTYDNFMESNLPVAIQQNLAQDHPDIDLHLVDQTQPPQGRATPKPQLTHHLPARYGRSPLKFQQHGNTISPDSPSTCKPGIPPWSHPNHSSLLRGNGRDMSISSNGDFQSSIVSETEPSVSSSDEDSQSDKTDASANSDQTIQSFWATDGSHYYPEDILVQRGEATHSSDEDDDVDSMSQVEDLLDEHDLASTCPLF
ncbi:hypothetical protein G7054_g4265 [Neopestalotiopsis clavispora]|nr:hypothetical protein G7054_g4265 [Neopestalotiopsis clavispora]